MWSSLVFQIPAVPMSFGIQKGAGGARPAGPGARSDYIPRHRHRSTTSDAFWDLRESRHVRLRLWMDVERDPGHAHTPRGGISRCEVESCQFRKQHGSSGPAIGQLDVKEQQHALWVGLNPPEVGWGRSRTPPGGLYVRRQPGALL